MFQHLEVAHGFIMVSSVLILTGIVTLLALKQRNLVITRKKRALREKHADYFAYVMAHLDTDETLKLPADALNKWDLLVLQEELIEMAERVKGAHRARLSVLFQQLGLPVREMNRLTSMLGARRIEAAYKLGAMGCGQAVPALLSLLDREKDEAGRFIIARAIARCARQGEDVRDMAVKMLDTLSASPRLMAELLNEARVDVVPVLKQWLQQDDHRLVLVAMASLPSQLDQGIANLLWPHLQSSEKEIRIQAAKLLLQGNLWLQPTEKEAFFTHEDWEIRAMAAKAAGRWTEEHLIPSLMKVMEDRNWWVRRNAALSLGLLGEAGFRALCEVAAHSTNEETAHLARQSIQRALRSDGPAHHQERLRKQRQAIYDSYFALRRHQAM